MKVTIKKGSPKDAEAIAQLHASSWKQHYRGICTDEYLDHEVDEERKLVWNRRFEIDNPLQKVLLAYDGSNLLCGFSCVYLDHHKNWGAYLDNLHVKPSHQRKGVGKALMKASAQLVINHNPGSYLYLHVLVDNKLALKFYENIGGKKIGTYEVDLPWGARGEVSDYLWKLNQLI